MKPIRLEDITIPFLKSEMSIKDFSAQVGLISSLRVGQMIIRDLDRIHKALFDKPIEIQKTPLKKEDRQKWLTLVDNYIKMCTTEELEDFGKKHKLKLVVKVRTDTILPKYYCYFKGIARTVGNGDTIGQALKNYCKEIGSKQIAIDKRVIICPKLINTKL